MSKPADDAANRNAPEGFESTSPTLLARARAGEAVAWERLVDLYAPLVYHWCRRCDLSTEDTADVFQEVFRSVAENLVKFRHERAGDTFRGWLRTIARNKINDHFRQRAGRAEAVGGSDAQLQIQAVADPLSEDDPSEVDVVRRQLFQALEAIRGELEERTWRAFWAVQVEGQATDDVAAALNMTTAAVRKAKYRVLRRLREELGDLLD